jgi:hypothetical protein
LFGGDNGVKESNDRDQAGIYELMDVIGMSSLRTWQ